LGPEDVLHLLFTCPAAQEIWRNLGISNIIDEATQADRSGSAVLEHLLMVQDNTVQGLDNVGLRELVCVTSWYLWWIRRRRTREEHVPTAYRCMISILSIVVNSAKLSAQGRHVTSDIKWSKPGPREVKLNVDASFHVDSYAGSTGAIIRDQQGGFVAASSSFLQYVASPLMAEAIAMREGLALAIKMGCSNVVAESDSLEVIQACTGEESWWNEAPAVFADCTDMRSHIGSVYFQYCPREANQVAHEIARDSFTSNSSSSWEAEAPRFIVNTLINDVT
jgi:ribonuclease HI